MAASAEGISPPFARRLRSRASAAPHEFSAATQSTFSDAIRMRRRISWLTFDCPPRGRERHRQYQRQPARCQATTVSGLTTTSTSDHSGQRLRSVVQNKRSKQFQADRPRLRFRTAVCCRIAYTSARAGGDCRRIFGGRRKLRTPSEHISVCNPCNVTPGRPSSRL